MDLGFQPPAQRTRLLRAEFAARFVLQLLCAADGVRWHGAMGAEMYLSPRPTPPLVGHTYITYQPLMPHEFLYRHHRSYYRDNGPYAGVTNVQCAGGNGSEQVQGFKFRKPAMVSPPRELAKQLRPIAVPPEGAVLRLLTLLRGAVEPPISENDRMKRFLTLTAIAAAMGLRPALCEPRFRRFTASGRRAAAVAQRILRSVLGRAHRAGRSAERGISSQLWLGRGRNPCRADLSPVRPTVSWLRPSRRHVYSDTKLAQRYAAVRRVLRSWTLVRSQESGVSGQESDLAPGPNAHSTDS